MIWLEKTHTHTHSHSHTKIRDTSQNILYLTCYFDHVSPPGSSTHVFLSNAIASWLSFSNKENAALLWEPMPHRNTQCHIKTKNLSLARWLCNIIDMPNESVSSYSSLFFLTKKKTFPGDHNPADCLRCHVFRLFPQQNQIEVLGLRWAEGTPLSDLIIP